MKSTGVPQISGEARLYALEELCRRAGLRDENWQRWQVRTAKDALVLRCVYGQGRVLFPAAIGELRRDRTVRKSWPKTPSAALQEVAPDLMVPFCCAGSSEGEPLFVETGPLQFQCTEDLLATIVLLLSRFEEMEKERADEHGRFRAVDSIASLYSFLDRPIVDEYGLALEQVIQALDSGFKPARRRVRVKVSHDVDLIGIPFNLREPAVQILARLKVAAGVRDLLSGYSGGVPGSLAQVMEICALAGERGLHSALHWKASARTAFDSGYDIADLRVARVMDWALAQGVEMGVHPGYYTFGNQEELAREVERCRQAIGEREIGGRQHYLRWSPQSWAHWEQCGLAYDSTLGYADRAGFRAGTCWPYFPWLWKENRRAELLEIPLIVMDQTLVSRKYMGCSPRKSLAVVRDLLRKCATVGGVFTLLWHNNCLGWPYALHYPRIFDALAGLENYDWREDAGRVERPRPMISH